LLSSVGSLENINNLQKDFGELKNRADNEIEASANLQELDAIFRKYLGKSGELTHFLRSLKDLPDFERREAGLKANALKNELLAAFAQKKSGLSEKSGQEMENSEWFDITVPGQKREAGHLHPLTLVRRQASEIFQQMGFSIALGPEIENEWYNFDALNIPKDHPARDIWDTLWLKAQSENKNKKLLLRTHTSPVQIRHMEKENPPLRIIAPGRVFRHEATDASHEVNFYQIEGLMVDKDISVANFKAIIQEFFRRFFAFPPKSIVGAGAEIRLRPSYFPFVEPGFEVDIACLSCGGKGCSACSQSGWLEIMGAGMVHPRVLEAVKLNPKDWTGFAFGMGLDRLAMMKYKINDIRLFYGGDLRFLKQF